MKKIINNKKYISSQTDLTKEWCFEKNKGKNPTHILIDSDEVVWWKCSKGHEWQAQINDRNRGNNCPYCSKKKQNSKYNEIGGENASTTGNVYGIYDMAGGAWEYVAGIYTGGTSNDDSSKLWDSNNSKYVDKYINTTGSRSTYYGNTDKYGDAVYETSSSGASGYNSWDSSHSYFPISSGPVFGRGGRAYLGNSAGVFAFGGDIGDAKTYLGFRPCLINLD